MNAERNAAIAMKRKAGRTFRSLADEYGLSRESIRRIEIIEEQREQRRKENFGLSIRTLNVIKNAALWPIALKNGAEAEAAKQVAEIGRAAFVGRPNIGKKTLRELDLWLEARGIEWSGA